MEAGQWELLRVFWKGENSNSQGNQLSAKMQKKKCSRHGYAGWRLDNGNYCEFAECVEMIQPLGQR